MGSMVASAGRSAAARGAGTRLVTQDIFFRNYTLDATIESESPGSEQGGN